MERPFYENYTRLVHETDLISALEQQRLVEFVRLRSITEEQGGTVHPPYTWTVKEALGHLIDGEIVFAYRAFRFSRHDATPLAGFDDQLFVEHGNADTQSVGELLDQLDLLRRANVAVFRALPTNAWDLSGTAAELQWKVSDLVKAMIGHIRHHQKIIESRCGL